jgi:hypothetical protein
MEESLASCLMSSEVCFSRFVSEKAAGNHQEGEQYPKNGKIAFERQFHIVQMPMVIDTSHSSTKLAPRHRYVSEVGYPAQQHNFESLLRDIDRARGGTATISNTDLGGLSGVKLNSQPKRIA